MCRFPKGPSAQIVGFQGSKTIQSMDFGTSNLTIWVLGPSGVRFLVEVFKATLRGYVPGSFSGIKFCVHQRLDGSLVSLFTWIQTGV